MSSAKARLTYTSSPGMVFAALLLPTDKGLKFLTTFQTPYEPFNSWTPKELGIPRATAMAVGLVVLICGFCY